MKKEKIVFVMALISIIISSIISVYAANYIYESKDVEYDNEGKNITSTNVQGAIDELYTDANNYSSINTRVTNLETTISGKQNTITGGASTITSSNLTTNRALISNASGKVGVSNITSTQLGYLSGVTSNVQTQLNSKATTTYVNNSVANCVKYTYVSWYNSLQFTLNEGHQAIVLINHNAVYVVWRNGAGLDTQKIYGSDTASFSYSGTTITVNTGGNNASITAFIG